MKFTRRQLLIYASSIAASTLLLPGCKLKTSPLSTLPSNFDNPFKLGVACGDPVSDGFVIWSRLIFFEYDLQSSPKESMQVTWRISTDKSMLPVIQSGHVFAKPENAHAVHVDVSELKHNREYFYQFQIGEFFSTVGRGITSPLVGEQIDSYRFAFVSCQDISGGHYSAYNDLVLKKPSLVIHTGDYIYEKEYIGGDRRIPVPEAFSLEDYRHLYTRYKKDKSLQKAHAICPWLVIWDDHEVNDNWGGDFSGLTGDDESFVKRKTVAFRAYYENMPIRLSSKLCDSSIKIYQNNVIGNLIQFSLLDCRQYRDLPDSKLISKSMLGGKQENWLKRSLGAYGAKWNVLVQSTVMAPMDIKAGPTIGYNHDGWDSFPESRQRILDWIASKNISNPIAIGGDIHAFYAGIVNRVATDFNSPSLITEFVTTSISSGGGGNKRYQQAVRAENPPLAFFENRVRGYALCDVSQNDLLVTFRRVENVNNPNSTCTTLKRLLVKDNQVGITQIN